MVTGGMIGSRHYCYTVPYDEFGNQNYSAPWQDVAVGRQSSKTTASNNKAMWIQLLHKTQRPNRIR